MAAQSQVGREAGGGKREEVSIKIAQGEVVFIEAKKVAEFMKVGGADLLGEDLRIAPGQIPKILEVEDDARRRIGGSGIGFQATGTLEQAEQIRFKPLVQHQLVRNILIESDHGFRGRAKFQGQAGASLFHAERGEMVQVGFQICPKFKFQFKKSHFGKFPNPIPAED